MRWTHVQKYRREITPPSHRMATTQRPRQPDISQSFVESPKSAENVCKLVSIFTRWRCFGVHSYGVVAFLLSPRGVLSRSHRVLDDDRLRAHGVLKECSRHARSSHGARTVPTPSWRRAQNVRTASAVKAGCHSRSPLQSTSKFNFTQMIHFNFFTISITPTHDEVTSFNLSTIVRDSVGLYRRLRREGCLVTGRLWTRNDVLYIVPCS